jgi:hypothetical protein
MFPIPVSPAKRSKRPRRRANGANRSIEITRALPPGEVVARLDQLRSELQCVEEAIQALERLALSRFPAPRARTLKAGDDSFNCGYGRA